MRHRSLFILAALFLNSDLSLFAQEPVLVKPQAAGDKPDNASYLIGFNIGTDLRQNGFNEKDFVFAQVIKGITDALSGKKAAISDAEIATTGKAITDKLQARAALLVRENLEKAKAFLAENQKKDGVQTLPSGLQYLVLKKGQGKLPTLTSEVRVNYEGRLLNGEVFDASAKHGGPAQFPVGGVIPGWTEALQRMAVGDKWKLFIPPDLAYGPNGHAGIGPNEALIFEVELLDIVN